MRSLFIRIALSCAFAASVTCSALAGPREDNALLHQVNFGNALKVEQWLNSGASAKAIGSDGWAALPLAIVRGDAEGTKIAKMLVLKGADVNAYDPNGETPLINAITLNNKEIIETLLAAKADLFLASKSGMVPAQYAEHYGNEEVNTAIKNALKEFQEDAVYGVSTTRLQKTLQTYIFENCVYAYIDYNQITNLYAHHDTQDFSERRERAKHQINQTSNVLNQTYHMHGGHIIKFAKETQASITAELDGLISTRNRRNLGVGTEEDMNNRCNRITQSWAVRYREVGEPMRRNQ